MVKPHHSFRKMRTRTLIQLGSLVEKCGVLSTLNIAIGVDQDVHHSDAHSVLLGALSDINEAIKTDEKKRELWLKCGENILNMEGKC